MFGFESISSKSESPMDGSDSAIFALRYQLCFILNQLSSVPNQPCMTLNQLSSVPNQLSSVSNQPSMTPNQLSSVPNQPGMTLNQLSSVLNQLFINLISYTKSVMSVSKSILFYSE